MNAEEAKDRIRLAAEGFYEDQERERMGLRKKPRQKQKLEHTAQSRVVAWLRERGHFVFAVPNAGKRHNGEEMVDEGLTAGAPDLVIATPPPIGGFGAAAIEMKKFHGGTMSPAQWRFLQSLSACKWATHVAEGETDAIGWLTRMGYGK